MTTKVVLTDTGGDELELVLNEDGQLYLETTGGAQVEVTFDALRGVLAYLEAQCDA